MTIMFYPKSCCIIGGKMQSIIVAVTFEDMKSFIYESVSKHKKDNGLMFDISSLPSPFQPGMKI